MRQHSDRAKQFAPYAALRGFDAVVAKKREITEPRRELSEYECGLLSDRLSQIEKGSYVRLTYYMTDRYVTLEGTVTGADKVFRTIKICKTVIDFDDIYELVFLSNE